MGKLTTDLIIMLLLSAGISCAEFEDKCGKRVALKALESFQSLEERSQPVKLDVTVVGKSYEQMASYVNGSSEILKDQKHRLDKGLEKCEKTYFWPTKFLCLVKNQHERDDLASVCKSIGYRSYRPRNDKRDLELLKSLVNLGIEWVPVVVDASGKAIFNLNDEFVTNFNGDVSLIKDISQFPIFVGYNEDEDRLDMGRKDLDPGLTSYRVLCESDPIWYAHGNPMAEVYGHTLREFLEKSLDLTHNLRKQFKIGKHGTKISKTYSPLTLKPNGKLQRALIATYLMSDLESWQKGETATSLHPVFEDLKKLEISKDQINYELETKDIEGIRPVFDLGTEDHLDSKVKFKVDFVKWERDRRIAYGVMTLRSASASNTLNQYRILPFSNTGKIVEGRYLYEGKGTSFVSMANLAQEEKCTQNVCDLRNFMDSSTIQERSCARYLLNKGGKEVDCSFKDHPWPLAYRLVCRGNETNIVTNPEPLALGFICRNDDSAEVKIGAGVHRFQSGCQLTVDGDTLLPGGNSPIVVPDHLDDGIEEGDPIIYGGSAAFGVLFTFSAVGFYAFCRIYKGLPFWCCHECCINKCRSVDDNESLDGLSGVSTVSRNVRRNARIIRNLSEANAPPPDYATLRTGNPGVSQNGRPIVRNRDLLNSPDVAQPNAVGGPGLNERDVQEMVSLANSRYRSDAPESRPLL